MAEKVITTLHSEDDTSKEIYPNILEDNIPQTFKDSINTKISNNTSSITKEKESRENLIHLEDTGEIAVGASDHVVELVGTQIKARSPIYAYDELHVNEVKNIGDEVISIQSEDIDIVGNISVDSSHIVSLKNINNLGTNHDINIISNNANLQLEGTQVNVVGNFSVNGDAMATQRKLIEEISSRANADTQIQTNLSKEIQERKEQDITLQNNIDKKQDKLTAGVGIEIENNVISVLGYHYSKFVFEGTSTLLTSVSGECAIAFDSSTQSVDMEKMINIYPFNQIKREEIQLYKDSALTTQLSGKDMFTTFPNLYWCATIGSDSQTLTFEFANYKVNDKFHRVYEDNSINKCGIACYMATEDTSDSSNNRLRSNTTTNNGIFKVSMNQETCENELPYLSNGDKADMLDSRVWFAYSALAQCFIGARNGQKKYLGIVDYALNSGDYVTEQGVRASENLGGTWIAGACDTLAQTSTMTGEITTWTENDVTTEIASGKRPFIVLGVENPYGLLWQNLGGIYHTDQHLYQYQATKHKSNSSFNTSDCELIGTDLWATEGFQLKFNQNNGVVYPISLGGNDSSTCGDYYWYESGNRIFVVGGRWDLGSYCGFSYLNGIDYFGAMYPRVGFRLSIKI